MSPPPGAVIRDVHVVGAIAGSVRFAEFCRINEGGVNGGEFLAVPLVDGTGVGRAELAVNGLLADTVPYPPDSVATLLTHLALWRKAVIDDTVLTICRDGALFNLRFHNLSNVLYGFCRETCDVVYWGWSLDAVLRYGLMPGPVQSVMRCQADGLAGGSSDYQRASLYPSVFRLHEIYGLVCYTVSPRGAKKLLERVVPIHAPTVFSVANDRLLDNVGLDITLNLLHSTLHSYVAIPPLAVAVGDPRTLPEDMDKKTTRRSFMIE